MGHSTARLLAEQSRAEQTRLPALLAAVRDGAQRLADGHDDWLSS